jgi:uncharacterized repeat protein (TIGR03803 family)
MASLTTLLNFSGSNGLGPRGTLISDSNGDLFGTTQQGGTGNAGTVFELVNQGSGHYALTTLVSFPAQPGANLGPDAGLVTDAAGDLFGTTQEGGAYGLGTVFKISKLGGGGYASTPTTLISFDHQNAAWPEAVPILDSAGDIFGTSLRGGGPNGGVVYEIPLTNGSYATATTTLANFDGPNGEDLQGGFVADSQGDLFGTTIYGGAAGGGVVFELVKSGATYTQTVLVNFNGADGSLLDSGLVMDAAGDLFGTSQQGGTGGYGTVYEIVHSGGTYASVPTTLANFTGANGAAPFSGVILDAAGDVFGTTEQGGTSNAGTVFEIAKTNGIYASDADQFQRHQRINANRRPVCRCRGQSIWHDLERGDEWRRHRV